MKLRKLIAASGVGVALAFGVIGGGLATASADTPSTQVHADYSHSPGTLYGCWACEQIMDQELQEGIG